MSNFNNMTVEMVAKYFEKCYPNGIVVPSYYIDRGVLSVYKLYEYYECFQNGVITQRNGLKYSGSLSTGSIKTNISYANPRSNSKTASAVLNNTFIVNGDKVYLNYDYEHLKNAFSSGASQKTNNVKMAIKHILQF